MSNRELIKTEIDTLPDDMVNFIYDFVFFLKQSRITATKFSDETTEGYQTLLKFKGTLKRDIDIKAERLVSLDEKYNRFS